MEDVEASIVMPPNIAVFLSSVSVENADGLASSKSSLVFLQYAFKLSVPFGGRFIELYCSVISLNMPVLVD